MTDRYHTDEYREWNRARMRRYRNEAYGIHEYTRRRIRALQAERERLLAVLQDNRKEQQWTKMRISYFEHAESS